MESRVLYLLLSIAVNFPILNNIGVRFAKIPILLVKSGQTQFISKILCSSDFVLFFNYPSERKLIESALIQKRYGVILIACNSKKYRLELIEELYSIMLSGRVNGSSIHTTPVLITEDTYIEDKNNYLFSLSLDEDYSKQSMSIEDVLPGEDYVSYMENLYTRNNDNNGDVQTLILAAYLIYGSHHREDVLNNDLEYIKRLIKYDEEYHDPSGLDNIFLNSFNTYASLNTIIFCELPNVNHDLEENSDNVLFYTQDYIFLNERFFKAVSEELIKSVPINALKRCLVDSGILITDNCATKSYTVKMYYVTEMGQNNNMRMYRIDRKMLARNGEMDCVDEHLLERRISN